MGRREAWSAEKSADSRTKPTRWEFTRRNNYNESMREHQIAHNVDEDNNRRVRSADEQHRRIKIKNRFKDINTAKDHHFHNSRTNLINDRDVYIEDVEHNEKIYKNQSKSKTHHQQTQIDDRHIDDDSMRRHEIDRGSDLGYRGSFKRTTGERTHGGGDGGGNRELFIKDGNAEILQLMTRGKHDEENIYVNIPASKTTNLTQPHLIMVDNSGKEILMRRFIEEQPDGKQIIREHYQIVPGATYIQTLPNEVQTVTNVQDIYTGKSGPNSVVYSQLEPEVKVYHTQPTEGGQIRPGDGGITDRSRGTEGFGQLNGAQSNQSLHQELETSLKQQNALLRQILLEKEKLEERYNQQEVALETQSLPCQSMAIATQTDCEAGTQTCDIDTIDIKDKDKSGLSGKTRRRAKSENDDSMSEDEYEYVRYSPPNSPEGVYWIKRKRQRKKSKSRSISEDRTPRKRVVMVEQVKRSIRTPIKEENEELEYRLRRSPQMKRQRETKTSMLRRMKNEANIKSKASSSKLIKSPPLNKDILMEISDSLDEVSPQDGRKHKIRVKEIEYYGNSEIESDGDEIVIRRNTYSADSIDEHSDIEGGHRFEIHVTDGRHKNYTRQTSSIEHHRDDEDHYKQRKFQSTKSVPVTPIIQPRLSRKDSTSRESLRKRQTTSEPPNRQVKGQAPKPPPTDNRKSKKSSMDDRIYQSEADLVVTVEQQEEDEREPSKSVPKYMEWYYGKKKTSLDRNENLKGSSEKIGKSKISSNKKLVSGSEKRINKSRQIKITDESIPSDSVKFKPEPLPRKSPPKNSRMLKEDVMLNKTLKPKIETDSNHPLLQHSEHRFERDYDPVPEIPIPPTKLPHYMYPETPPSYMSKDLKKTGKETKPKPSPIKEDEVKVTKSKTTVYIDDGKTNGNINTSQSQSKQLNVSTLEDDHDSGIAMNSLLHSMGRRNPIAEKKSVFTIAYDDVSRVQKIQSGSDSPQFS